MNCCIANAELTCAIDRWPNVPPTESLCVGALMILAIKADIPRPAAGFFISIEALGRVRQCDGFPQASSMFYIPLLGNLKRYDWVITSGKGEWVERGSDDALYECAPYEDAEIVNLETRKTCAVLRYRRVVQMEELEFSE